MSNCNIIVICILYFKCMKYVYKPKLKNQFV